MSGYAYWIVNKQMTLTTELVRGHFHSSKSIPSFVPKQVDATVFSVDIVIVMRLDSTQI